METTRSIIWMIDGLGPGGAEQLMPTILKHLRQVGVDVRICVLQVKHGNPTATELERLGLPVDLVLIPNLRHPLNLFRILRYLRLYRPQILHTQLEFADILGTVAAKILGIPTIATLHTLDVSEEYGTATWRLKLRWFILKNLTDHVIAVSEKTRNHHIHTARISAQKISTIYNGVELARFKNSTPEQRTSLKQTLHLPTNGKIITTVAVLREPKGIQFMIQALPAILKEFSDAHYLIVGDGAYRAPLLKLVESLGLQKNVTFAGHRTDIPALLDCSDVFVLPTLIDALPTVLIEALAAEKPIVASNVGGVPEIVTDGVNGLLVPAGEPARLTGACLRLLKDKKLGQELVMAGNQTVRQRFDVTVQIGQLLRIYDRVLSVHGKHTAQQTYPNHGC